MGADCEEVAETDFAYQGAVGRDERTLSIHSEIGSIWVPAGFPLSSVPVARRTPVNPSAFDHRGRAPAFQIGGIDVNGEDLTHRQEDAS